MDKFLREWRQDAVNKHQYETAIFVADKLLALTGMRFWMQTNRALLIPLQEMIKTHSIWLRSTSAPATTTARNRSSLEVT